MNIVILINIKLISLLYVFLYILIEASFWTQDRLIDRVFNNFVHIVGLLLWTARMKFRMRFNHQQLLMQILTLFEDPSVRG